MRSSGSAAQRAPFKVGDAVQAYNGAAGPYAATVQEVEQDGAYYVLDWADRDPNKRRQPAENVLAAAVHPDNRASGSFRRVVSPHRRAAVAAAGGREQELVEKGAEEPEAPGEGENPGLRAGGRGAADFGGEPARGGGRGGDCGAFCCESTCR